MLRLYARRCSAFWIVEVMIREPPAAPMVAKRVLLLEWVIINGLILESGRFPGRMKLASEGTYPKAFVVLGIEKS
jgi:hypothetical protein